MTKKSLFALLLLCRLTRVVAWVNRKKVNILCYHSVTNQSEINFEDPHKLHLKVDTFRRQLDYLQAHYKFITLREFINARLENTELPANAVVLTFDDGLRNFLTLVAPLLIERKIPATIFVVTSEDFTSQSSNSSETWGPKDDHTYLSWDEIGRLAELGFDFGSHTSSHASLPSISLSEARRELSESLAKLTANLGVFEFPLAYPHGQTSTEITELARALGYSCALTTALGQNGPECDLFMLQRTVIASDDDVPTFAARLSGLTALYNQITRAFGVPITEQEELLPGSYEPIAIEEAGQ